MVMKNTMTNKMRGVLSTLSTLVVLSLCQPVRLITCSMILDHFTFSSYVSWLVATDEGFGVERSERSEPVVVCDADGVHCSFFDSGA